MKLRSLKYLFVDGLKNIWINRMMSIASIGVLVACMVLMGTAILFSLNVEQALNKLQDQNVVMAYFKDETSKDSAMIALQQVKSLDNVKHAVFVSNEEGLDSIISDMGEQYKDLFNWLGENEKHFLPHAIKISFKDLEFYDQTIKQIKAIDNIDHINDSKELTRVIMSIKKMVSTAGFWVIGLLLITALVIISNTIKITMHSRKLEISIMKAVGATKNFIRMPFVIEGMVLGIISATISTGLLSFAYKMTINQLKSIMVINEIRFSSVAWIIFFAFCLIGLIAGCIGSVISIGKYLRKEGSEFRAF